MQSDRSKSSDGLPPPLVIEKQGELDALVDALQGVQELAVDTEADSFYHYREKVCLIQVTADEVDYLIDPLAPIDLTSFGAVLADPSRTKVFHDGEYDILILKRDYGFTFRNLFDTRVAAAALGVEAPGLASVLLNRFGVKLDKSLQRSNWSTRPLSDKQISYARLDTHYLLRLAAEQRDELAERDRMMIVAGECERLEAIEPPEREFHPDDFIRMKGARSLKGGALQALRELFILRDRLAQERDVPPFKVLSHGALIDLARARPKTLRGLDKSGLLSSRQIRKLGPDIIGAIERANERGNLKRIPSPPSRADAVYLDEEETELHERLKAWRKDRAKAEGIDASLILNRRVLVSLAKGKPRDPGALARTEGLLRWQVDRFGDQLLRIVVDFLREEG